MFKLRLYMTSGCHLCEEAKAVIAFASERLCVPPLALDIEEVDIADDDKLVEKYGVSIPVVKLLSGPEGELSWPFTPEEFCLFIQDFSLSVDTY